MNDCVSEWDRDDNDILRQVLAQSQQEYLDTLKRKAREANTESSHDKASSSGLNDYYDEAFRDSDTGDLSGSPNKKLKVSNTSAKLERSELDEQVNETADKTVDRSETDKETNDNEKCTRHEVSSQALSEERDRNEEAANEPIESVKDAEPSEEAASSSDRSQDASSKH